MTADGAHDPRVVDEITRLWAELLNCGAVEGDDDFFDLGGDSMLAVRMTMAVKQRLGVDTSLNDLVECPTAAEYAARIESRAAAT